MKRVHDSRGHCGEQKPHQHEHDVKTLPRIEPDPAILKLKESSLTIELTFSQIELEALCFIFRFLDEHFTDPDVIESILFHPSHAEVQEVGHLLDAVEDPSNAIRSVSLTYCQWQTYAGVLAYPNLDWLPLKQEWLELELLDEHWKAIDEQQSYWDEQMKYIR